MLENRPKSLLCRPSCYSAGQREQAASAAKGATTEQRHCWAESHSKARPVLPSRLTTTAAARTLLRWGAEPRARCAGLLGDTALLQCCWRHRTYPHATQGSSPESCVVVKSQLHLSLLPTGHVFSDVGFDFSLHHCQLLSPNIQLKVKPSQACKRWITAYKKILGNAVSRSRIGLRCMKENRQYFTHGWILACITPM